MVKLFSVVCFLLFTAVVFGQWDEKSESSSSFLAVDIHESGVCYAVGFPFMKSEDSGETWSDVPFPGADSLYFDFAVLNDVKILSATTTVAVGWHASNNNNIIIRSDDSGATWSVVFDGLYGTGLQFRAVSFFDESLGVAVGDNGLSYKTVDGGASWSYYPTGTTNDLKDVIFLSSSRVVAVGSQKIIRSFDGGSSWVVQTHTNKYFYSADYEGGDITVTYRQGPDYDSYLYTSDDLGVSWTTRDIDHGNIKCHDALPGDTLYLGYEYDLLLGLTEEVYPYLFTDYEFEGISDILFKDGYGLAVTQQFDESKIYKFYYGDPWSLEQKVDFSVPDTICVGETSTYTPTNPTLESYEWFVDDESESLDTEFSFVHLEEGEVTIMLVTEFEGYSDTVEHVVTVNTAPEVSAILVEGDTIICTGDAYEFTLVNIADGTGFSVSVGGVEVPFDSETEDDRHYALETLTETTTFEISKWAINSCDSVGITETFMVEVEAYPDPGTVFYGMDSLVCFGDSSQIVLPTPEPDMTYVFFEDGDSIGAVLSDGSPLSFYTSEITTEQFYTVEAFSTIGCHSDLLLIDSIGVDEVSAHFSVGLGYYFVDSLIIVDTSEIVGDYYDWAVTGTPVVFEDTAEIHPNIVFDETGLYELTLVVETAHAGCIDSLTEPILVYNLPTDTTDKTQCFLQDINRIEVLDQTIDRFGNLILVGYKRVEGYWGTHIAGGVIQKYDSEGNLLWEWVHERDVPSHTDHRCVMYSAVTTDQFGNIYFTGSMDIKRFKYQEYEVYVEGESWKRKKTFVMKVNPDGDFLWMDYAFAQVNDDGFSDVLFDSNTNSLFVAGPFSGGPSHLLISTNHGSQYVEQGELQVLHLDPTGLLLTSHLAQASPHVLNSGGGKFVPPGMLGSGSRKCYIRPVMEMGTDSLIYLFGPTSGTVIFEEVDTLYPVEQGNYVAVLDPYGPDSGWVKAALLPEAGEGAHIRGTLDSDNNIYVSVGYNDSLGGDSYGHTGTGVFKYDNDLNLVWYRTFENLYLKDIICENDNDIYFLGNSNDYYAIHVDEAPYTATIFEDSTFVQTIVGIITTDGEVLWEDFIGDSDNDESFRLAGNSCGEVYATAKSTVHSYAWDHASPYYREGSDLEVELGGIVYEDSINGSYLIKLSDSLCIVGGCATLCEDPDFWPNPFIYVSDLELSTDEEYVTYQWYKDGEEIPGETTYIYLCTEPGVYVLEVTDLNGCTGESDPFEVTCEMGFAPEPTVTDLGGGLLTTELFDSYQWYKNGEEIPGATEQTYLYSSPGDYTVIVSEGDCFEESDVFEVECADGFEPEPTITDLGGTLTTEEYDAYQWQRDGEEIPGATEQTYDYTEGGLYAVEVMLDDCAGLSDVLEVEDLGYQDLTEKIGLKIYPNPANAELIVHIELEEDEFVSIQLVDITGRIVSERNCGKMSNGANYQKIDVSGLSSGMYVCSVSVDGVVYRGVIEVLH